MNDTLLSIFRACVNCAVDFCFCLAIIMIIVRLFKIKNPRLRYFLFLIPFIKLWYDSFSLFFTGALSPALHFHRNTFDLCFSIGLGASGISLWSLIFSCIISNYRYSLGDIALGIIGNKAAIWFVCAWLPIALFLVARRYIAYFRFIRRIESSMIECPEYGIFLSSRVTSPMVMGVIKPRIIIPTELYNSLTEDELSLVLRHEKNHIQRKDNLMNHLISVTRDIFFFIIPLSYLIRNLSLEREKLCDRMAIGEKVESALQLAKAMLKVAEARLRERREISQDVIPVTTLYSPKQSELTLRVSDMLSFRGESKGIMRHSFISFLIFLIILKILIGTSFFATSGMSITVTALAVNIIVTA